jgi:hypothetical protein
MRFRELDTVALAVDLPDHGLAKDDLGAVVHVHGDGAAYEVEFVDVGGRTINVVSLSESELLPHGPRTDTDHRELRL